MKKILVSIIVSMFAIMLTLAAEDPVTKRYNDAKNVMFIDRNFSKAKADFEKIVKDNATTNKVILSQAQAGIGMCLIRMNKAEEAITEFQKALDNYPEIDTFHKANVSSLIGSAYLSKMDFDTCITYNRQCLITYKDVGDTSLAQFQSSIGMAYFRKKDYDNALIEYQKVISNYSQTRYVPTLFQTYDQIGNIYQLQRKFTEANLSWMNGIQKYVWELGAKDKNGVVWKTWNKISPKYVTEEQYKSFLENTLKAIPPPLEDNAEFAGAVKSALGKIKL